MKRSILQRYRGRAKEVLCSKISVPYISTFLPLNLAKHFKRNAPISLIDIGAHNGSFTEAIEDYCGVRRGVLIEPLPDKAAELRRNFLPPRYTVSECVVSSEPGIVDLEVNSSAMSSSILSLRTDLPEWNEFGYFVSEKIRCNSRTLDQIGVDCNVDAIDLLKVDVQGAEHLVFAGASSILKKTKMVWVEVSFRPLYHGSCTFNDVYSLLVDAGFKLLEIDPGYRSPKDTELLQADALFARGR